MYEFYVKKHIHACFSACSSSDKYLRKKINLPFPPYVGLDFVDGDWQATLEAVFWDCSEGKFKCYAESCKEIYDAQLARRPHRKIEEIIAEYLESGWEIDE